MTTNEKRINDYAEFWDFYVAEHNHPLTRNLHFAGTTFAAVLLIYIVRSGDYFYIPLCFVVAYGFAWGAHFFVEHNEPATFKYPFWSFISDYKMVFYMLIGAMNAEVARVEKQKQEAEH